MSKITSKYQVTVPRAIADKYNMHPGDEIDWIPTGEIIRVIPPGQQAAVGDVSAQLKLFDQATERHSARAPLKRKKPAADRGWTRQDLYERGRPH